MNDYSEEDGPTLLNALLWLAAIGAAGLTIFVWAC